MKLENVSSPRLNQVKNITTTITKIARRELLRCLDCGELFDSDKKKCPFCDCEYNEPASLDDYLWLNRETVNIDYIVSSTGRLKRAEITFNKWFPIKLYSDNGRIIEETSGFTIVLPDDVTYAVQEAVRLMAPSTIS